MHTNTATEYRNLPLAVLTESATNPRRIFEDAALKELAESIRSQGVLSPLLVRPLTDQSFEIVAGARGYRAAQNGGGSYRARPDRQPHRCRGTGSSANRIIYSWQEFSLPLCDLARRLYVIDVPGLPQIAGYNGLPQPRAMACDPDSRFGTLVIRHRIQSNSPRETLRTVVSFRIGDDPTGGRDLASWVWPDCRRYAYRQKSIAALLIRSSCRRMSSTALTRGQEDHRPQLDITFPSMPVGRRSTRDPQECDHEKFHCRPGHDSLHGDPGLRMMPARVFNSNNSLSIIFPSTRHGLRVVFESALPAFEDMQWHDAPLSHY